jgi:polysaccharide biosynthesis/export protein
MRGEIEDMPLKREDVITIRSISSLREKRVVTIRGEVNKEGKYPYVEGLTVADLIVLADGFSDGASSSKIELARRVEEDTTGLPANQNVIIKTFDIDKNLKISADDAKTLLQAYDKIYVHKLPRYESQKTVNIEGEVKYPGSYTIKDKTQRISDLLLLAGGFREGAFKEGAVFRRDSTIIAINFLKILQNPEVKDNLLLVGGDNLNIPRENQTVKLTGEVLNPVSIAFSSGFTTKDYIAQAGGFTDKASKRRVYVKYANGISDKTKTFLFFTTYPKIVQGSEIIVPPIPTDNNNKMTTAEKVSILGAISSISYIVISIVNALNK